MTRWWNWVNRYVNELLFWSVIGVMLLTMFGCVTVDETTYLEFSYCKAGVGGEYRILVPQDRTQLPLVAVFSVGGPYDQDHVICIISGDHAILDLGKGKPL